MRAWRPPDHFIVVLAAIVLVGTITAGANTTTDVSTTLTDIQEEFTDLNLANADATIQGTNGSTTGWSVANVGDVNGDGTGDILVGAPRTADGGSNVGAAYLFYGPLEGDLTVDNADVTFTGEADGDFAGWSIAGAGDLDDDGNADLIIGAPGHDGDGQNSGAAYVFHGGELAGSVNLADADAKLTGEASDDQAGWSVDGVGTADCAAGVIVGAPSHADKTGAAYIVATDSLTSDMSLADADAKLTGEAAGDAAAFALGGAGESVLVGAPRNDGGGEDAGAAYHVQADCPTEATPTEEPVDTPTETGTEMATPTETETPTETATPTASPSPTPTEATPSPSPSPTTEEPSPSPSPDDQPAGNVVVEDGQYEQVTLRNTADVTAVVTIDSHHGAQTVTLSPGEARTVEAPSQLHTPMRAETEAGRPMTVNGEESIDATIWDWAHKEATFDASSPSCETLQISNPDDGHPFEVPIRVQVTGDEFSDGVTVAEGGQQTLDVPAGTYGLIGRPAESNVEVVRPPGDVTVESCDDGTSSDDGNSSDT